MTTAQPNSPLGRSLIWLIIACGVVMVAISAVYTSFKIADTFLNFNLIQIFWVGIFCLIAGFLLLLWARSSITLARMIVLFIMIAGIVMIGASLLFNVAKIADNILSFGLNEVLILGILYLAAGIILSLFFRSRMVEATSPLPMATPRVAAQAVPPQAKPASVANPDDLTVIEGIGPKSAEALRKAGINSYAQLAVTSSEELYRIVRIENNVQIVGDTATWPKQAQFLVKGDKVGLDAYTRRLVSGREPKQ